MQTKSMEFGVDDTGNDIFIDFLGRKHVAFFKPHAQCDLAQRQKQDGRYAIVLSWQEEVDMQRGTDRTSER